MSSTKSWWHFGTHHCFWIFLVNWTLFCYYIRMKSLILTLNCILNFSHILKKSFSLFIHLYSFSIKLIITYWMCPFYFRNTFLLLFSHNFGFCGLFVQPLMKICFDLISFSCIFSQNFRYFINIRSISHDRVLKHNIVYIINMLHQLLTARLFFLFFILRSALPQILWRLSCNFSIYWFF